MFEIGNTLREARSRRGIEVSQAEADTKIRAKYLRAMEEEQFDLLPAPSYVRGFLKSYAEYLGLDGRLVLDEYDSRFGSFAAGPGEHEPGGHVAPPGRGRGRARRPAVRRPRSGRRTEAQLLWMAIGGVIGVALLVWIGAGGDDPPPPAPVEPAAPAAVRPAAGPPPGPAPAAEPPPPPPPAAVRVLFRGTGDTGSYLEVRGGGAGGPSVYTGILTPGTSLAYRVKRGLWIRVGNTPGLEVEVDGVRRVLEGGTADFIVTRRGVRRIDPGG